MTTLPASPLPDDESSGSHAAVRGVSKRLHRFHSQWIDLLHQYFRDQRQSALGLANKLGIPQSTMAAYSTGKNRPPAQDMPRWATVMGLKGEPRMKFIVAAWETWTPEEVWFRLEQLEYDKLMLEERLRVAKSKIVTISE